MCVCVCVSVCVCLCVCVCVCVCGVAVEVASSAGDFSDRSIQRHHRGHHLIIIRTNGRTDRQNNEMVITGGGRGRRSYMVITLNEGHDMRRQRASVGKQEHVNST